uniref:Uncharacterized protein n=2 Tax=Photinus pyralis TaxID=7054 RepID=A0A1Y1L3T5_PHOPY
MAVQFGHSKVFNLLVEVYHADPDVRDFSGRMPEQYKISETQNSNKDTYSEYRRPGKPGEYRIPGKHTKHQSFLRKNFNPSQRRAKSTHEVAVETTTNHTTSHA